MLITFLVHVSCSFKMHHCFTQSEQERQFFYSVWKRSVGVKGYLVHFNYQSCNFIRLCLRVFQWFKTTAVSSSIFTHSICKNFWAVLLSILYFAQRSCNVKMARWNENLSNAFWGKRALHHIIKCDNADERMKKKQWENESRRQLELNKRTKFAEKFRDYLLENQSMSLPGAIIATNLQFWIEHMSWAYCKLL